MECYEHDYLREAEYKIEMLTKLIDKTEAGMYVTDFYTGEVLYVNRKMESYGNGLYTAEDMLGKVCWSFFNINDTERCSYCPYKKLIGTEGELLEPYVWEHFFPSYNVWLKITSEAIHWVDGRVAHMITFFDISTEKNIQKKLSDLAYFDQKLHLKNAAKLERDIQEAIEKPSMIILDIVALKRINEAFGRGIGDSMLLLVRDWLIGQTLNDFELYRIGGDEFALVATNATHNVVIDYAETLFQRFLTPWTFNAEGGELRITCSATIGVIQGNYIEADESLFNLISRTLEAAKNQDNVLIYNEEIEKVFKKQLELEWSLKQSVYEDMCGFMVYYQPIAYGSTGKWRGLEALCRWNSPELGFVSPLTFIPEAERLALIGKIGLWVLETAVKNCKEWGLDKKSDFVLNVNLSALQFSNETLVETILDTLSKYDYPNEKLCLEITESNRFTFTDASLNTIETFNTNRILVALDDFGTGYSNFSNLKTLPVNVVKIEREFTKDIETNSYHLYLFRAMADLAHVADTRLVAEGVENDRQMKLLVENGADYLQGYLFSKPIPPDVVEQQLYRFNY